MPESKTPISNASSYAEVGEFWDSHDLSEHWDETHEVECQVSLGSSVIYFAVEKDLAEKLRSAARHHGVSADTLLNVWLKEHVASEPAGK
jgi:hypothetical protein